MRYKTILTLLIILVCFTPSAHAARIWVEPAQHEVSEGANFTVDIMVDPEGDDEVMGAEYKVYFNNTLLNATDQVQGSFLGGYPLVNEIDNTTGRTVYGEMIIGGVGVTTPGVLASITFQVIGERGVCDLVLDDVMLSNASAAEIPVNVTGGSVEVISGICGDVTGNNVVDTGDVILLSNFVGYPGYVLQNEWAGDVTGNGVIDTGDVILLSNFVGYSGYSLNCTG
jgi:hypothetical protein